MRLFKRVAPHPYLKKFISHYWYTFSDEKIQAPHQQRILPDTFTDIIFNYGNPLLRYEDGEMKNLSSSRSFVNGIMKTHSIVAVKGKQEAVGICFKPAYGRLFLNIPMDEIKTSRVDLSLLWKNRAREIYQRIGESPELKDKIHILDNFLLKLAATDLKIDYHIARTSQYIEEQKGLIKMDSLTDLSGLSLRQLERKFKREIGLNPKMLCRITRFKNAHQSIKVSETPLVEIAHRCGYSDQAHLCREIKHFSGLTPGEVI